MYSILTKNIWDNKNKNRTTDLKSVKLVLGVSIGSVSLFKLFSHVFCDLEDQLIH